MRTLVVAAVLMAAGCERAAQVPAAETVAAPEPATTSSGEMFALEPAELRAHIRRAESGDASAALRLSEHFAFAELDTAQEIRWLLVAAERGNIRAMRSLGHHYASDLSGHKNCQEALRWLKRAAKEATPAEAKEHGIEEQLAYVKRAQDACGKSGQRGMSPNNSSKPTPLRGAA